jgi:hypothetical protein
VDQKGIDTWRAALRASKAVLGGVVFCVDVVFDRHWHTIQRGQGQAGIFKVGQALNLKVDQVLSVVCKSVDLGLKCLGAVVHHGHILAQ